MVLNNTIPRTEMGGKGVECGISSVAAMPELFVMTDAQKEDYSRGYL